MRYWVRAPIEARCQVVMWERIDLDLVVLSCEDGPSPISSHANGSTFDPDCRSQPLWPSVVWFLFISSTDMPALASRYIGHACVGPDSDVEFLHRKCPRVWIHWRTVCQGGSVTIHGIADRKQRKSSRVERDVRVHRANVNRPRGGDWPPFNLYSQRVEGQVKGSSAGDDNWMMYSSQDDRISL